MDTNDERLYHQFLVRLDNELTEKLYNHATENDMKLTGVFRESLREYFQNETRTTSSLGKKQDVLK